MIEIPHEMVRYFVHVREIFVVTVILMRFITCCEKKNYGCFEKKFSEEQNCYFDTVFASIIIVCYDFLRFSKKKKKPFTINVYRNSLIRRYSFVLNLYY